MSVLRSFKAIRPCQKYVEEVVCPPYDVMTAEEAREIAKNNPKSFIHIDLPEVDFPNDVNPYSEEVYKKASENLKKAIEDGIYEKDDEATLYIYMLTEDGRSQTGIVGCVAVDDYNADCIKKHELTLKEKEDDRFNHFCYCRANTSPVFLSYKDSDGIKKLLEDYKSANEPIYNFTAEGVEHKIWKIKDQNVVTRLEFNFAFMGALYIADGHHRNASAARAAEALKDDYGENPECNYYPAVLFPQGELKIMEVNRLIKDFGGYTEAEFIEKLKYSYRVTEIEGEFKPEKEHETGLYTGGRWYKLEPKFISEDISEKLDVSILEHEVFDRILGIKDVRTDSRVDFVGGIKGADELKKRVDSGDMAAAFYMYPVTMDELIAISDEKKTMPPKSTWFEPKIRSGLFIHSFDD